MIEYRDTAEGLAPAQLAGFFEGWPNPPSVETHLALLRGTDVVVIAFHAADDTVAGFVTAVTDGVLSAYIPLLEVRPEFRGRGIGRALVTRMLERLDGLYMVDVLCDANVQPFYQALGFTPTVGASVRRYQHQSGRPEGSR